MRSIASVIKNVVRAAGGLGRCCIVVALAAGPAFAAGDAPLFQWKSTAPLLLPKPDAAHDGPFISDGVSRGEFVRDNYDKTPTVDFCRPVQFLYQALVPETGEKSYLKLPYRLALLTTTKQPAFCPARK